MLCPQTHLARNGAGLFVSKQALYNGYVITIHPCLHMYLTVHGAAGLAIAQAVPNPLAAFLVGLLSHFVLDFVPHGDEHLAQKHFSRGQTLRRLVGAALIDGVLLTGFLILYLWTTPWANYPASGAAVLGAVLPDALQGLAFATNWKGLDWFTKFHEGMHNSAGHKLSWQQGLMVQGLVLAGLWLFVI